MSETFPIDGSRDALWMQTAVAAPKTETLSTAEDCEVAIVGAGLTGLNAALLLAKAGKSVCVLDAKSIGFGASGRSGGQVNLGLNLGPAALIEKFGLDQGERMIDAVVNTPDRVFTLINKHELRCDAVQAGWIQGAINKRVSAEQKSLAAEYAQHGCELELLDKASMRHRTGTNLYSSGLLSPSAGFLQPLSYTRELARVAQENGAKIFTYSLVEQLVKDRDRWLLKTANGTVRCNKVLLCGNGYTDNLQKGLAETVVPVRSILMATAPLSTELRQSVLPKQVSFVDKRRLILYFRYDRDGRLCAGYHGPMRDSFRLQDYVLLKEKVTAIFPQLKDCIWERHWGGRIAITKNALPFIGEPLPGVISCMGYNGRGVGMGTLMGQAAAQHALGMENSDIAFPICEPSRFMLHRFHALGVNASIRWFELQEYVDSLQRS